MKIVVIQNESFDTRLMQDALSQSDVHPMYFGSVKAAVLHVNTCLDPFILISEVLSTAEISLKEIKRAFQLTHLRGVVLLSQYNDDIVDAARQIAKLSGQTNVGGLSLPATVGSIQDIVDKVIQNQKTGHVISLKTEKLNFDEINRAMQNDGLIPNYQPKYAIKEGKLVGFEILSRIRLDGNEYGPYSFISQIVTASCISEFTYIVFEKALNDFSKMKNFNGTLSLNVDYKSLNEPAFAENIIAMLDKYHFEASRLIVEVTEDNPQVNIHVIRSLTYLRIQGVCVAVDDFGMKNSGFSELFQLPFSEIKIDRSFIQDMQVSSRSYKVVQALCAVAQSLGYTTVAEGVETEEQKQMLEELNIDLVQGYLFSKPLPVEKVITLLESDKIQIPDCSNM